MNAILDRMVNRGGETIGTVADTARGKSDYP